MRVKGVGGSSTVKKTSACANALSSSHFSGTKELEIQCSCIFPHKGGEFCEFILAVIAMLISLGFTPSTMKGY